MRVAKDWHVPPLTALVGRPPVWRSEDTLLGIALRRYESSRVDAQGFPVRVSENPEFEDAWDVDAETINYPKMRMDEWHKANENPPAGVTPRVVFHPTIRPDER